MSDGEGSDFFDPPPPKSKKKPRHPPLSLIAQRIVAPRHGNCGQSRAHKAVVDGAAIVGEGESQA